MKDIFWKDARLKPLILKTLVGKKMCFIKPV